MADRTTTLSGLAAELRGLAAGLAMGGLQQNLLQMMSDEAVRCVLEAREPEGRPWPPLKRPEAGRRPLVRTGRLLASLSLGGPGNIATAGPQGIRFGTQVQYAVYQQKGTRRIPARPFLGVSRRLERKMEQMVATNLAERLRRGIGR